MLPLSCRRVEFELMKTPVDLDMWLRNSCRQAETRGTDWSVISEDCGVNKAQRVLQITVYQALTALLTLSHKIVTTPRGRFSFIIPPLFFYGGRNLDTERLINLFKL